MGKIDKLMGNDGYVVLGQIGDPFTGDATDSLDELAGGDAASGDGKGFYQVAAIAESDSAFDWDDPEVGDYLWDDGTLVLATGDEAIPLPKTPDGSVKSFEIPFTKDKIDTTVLIDRQKTYRMGKADASGTMTGVTKVGHEILSDRFLDRLDVASDGSKAMTRQVTTPAYFIGFLQGNEIPGEKMIAVVGRVDFESFSYGAQDGNAQEFNTGFAPVAGDRLQKVNIEVPSE